MALTIVLVSLLLLSSTYAKKGFGPGEQDWGYADVRDGAHIFWWLHYSTSTPSLNRPLILWLMGGPGGSSTGHGNFMMVGLQDEELKDRESSWVKDFNILFVDSPVGAGFSYVDNFQHLANDNMEIAQDLLELMRKFYETLPDFRRVPLYIYGHGYGGKIGADFAKIFREANIGVNLEALSMGNSWLSPINVTESYSSYLYQVGLIDETGAKSLKEQTSYTAKMYDTGMYYQATREWMRTLNLIYALTDGIDFGNILTKMPKISKMTDEKFEKYYVESITHSREAFDLNELMNGDVKTALNISSKVYWGSQANQVFENLYIDFMLPVTKTVEHLLNNTSVKVHICNGNLNPITPTTGELLYLNNMTWTNNTNFKNAERKTIWANNIMEGYKKEGGGLSFYWFNAAGAEFITANTEATREFLFSITGV